MRTSISLFAGLSLVTLVLASACQSQQPHQRPVIRLTDLYKPEIVSNRTVPDREPARTEWTFKDPAKIEEYASTGISNLKIKNGYLTGQATAPFPVIDIHRTQGLEDKDLVHSIEIRMKLSSGKNLSVIYESDEKVDFKKITDPNALSWRRSTPALPGDEFRTYVLTNPRSVSSSDVRHILIRPTDEAGATFEIESVRLIFRNEYLASIPSGIGWQGLSEIFRETLISRSPEAITFTMTLPPNPWLDLSLGTLENTPVRFSVDVQKKGSNSKEVLFRKTLTTPQRWDVCPIDLARFANQPIQLTLKTEAEEPGTIGFWGSPAIRSRGSLPLVTELNTQPPRGVILIWADTLRSDHLQLYGYDRATSPNLTRLAAEGVLFKHHVVQGTWTKVSTPSLMTSLYPTSHGIKDFTDRLPASATTLAELMQQAGYATLNLSSILFTGQFTNLHQGFDEVHEDTSLPDQKSSKTSRVYVDRLIPWLKSHKDVPFFVFLHVADPHDPYRPYAPYDRMWVDSSKAEEHERQAEEVRKHIQDPLLKQFGIPNREELVKAGFDPDEYMKMDIGWYDGSIRAMDTEIGRLLETLRELKIHEQTLLIFAGDHGEEFFDHGRTFHGQSVYSELSHTPLIFWQPGKLKAGATVNETVQNIDIMPTILQLCGLKIPANTQGRSLLPLIQSPANKGTAEATGMSGSRTAIIEKALTKDIGAPPPRDTASVSILTGKWKLIHNEQRLRTTPEYELYDLEKDPREKTNLASQNPQVVQRLLRQLGSWRKIAQSQKLKSDSEASKGMSREELERLRSLGYIQ